MLKIGKKVKFRNNDNICAALRGQKGTIVDCSHGSYTVQLDAKFGVGWSIINLVDEQHVIGIRGRPRKIVTEES